MQTSTPQTPAPITSQQNIDNKFEYANTANSLINQFVVSPLANIGIAGLTFSNAGDIEISLKSDITDHYVENNSTRQDHIALRPEIITLKGVIAEVAYINPKNKKTFLQNTVEKVTTISAMIPKITQGASQAYKSFTSKKTGAKDYISSYSSGGIDLYQTFKTLNPPKTKQAAAFNFFKALYTGRQLVSLETPYSFYSNMVIEEIKAHQGDDSRFITDFTITLKQMRFTTTKFVKFDKDKFQGNTQSQISDIENKTKAQGTSISKEKLTSTLQNMSNAVSGKKQSNNVPLKSVTSGIGDANTSFFNVSQ